MVEIMNNKKRIKFLMICLVIVSVLLLNISCRDIPPDIRTPEQSHKDDLWYKEKIQKDIDAGINLNLPLLRGRRTHLHEVALGDCIESAKLLISKGVNIDPKADAEDTPLHRACQNGSVRVAKLLIENGADIEARGMSETTPIFWAAYAETNQKEILELLYDNGAKIDVRDEYNNTPLIRAGSLGNSIAMKWFIGKNVDINACNEDGYTALHKSALLGYYKGVSVLLENEADVNALSNSNETPLDFALIPVEGKYASSKGKRRAADMIRNHGGKKAEELN